MIVDNIVNGPARSEVQFPTPIALPCPLRSVNRIKLKKEKGKSYTNGWFNLKYKWMVQALPIIFTAEQAFFILISPHVLERIVFASRSHRDPGVIEHPMCQGFAIADYWFGILQTKELQIQ